MALIPEMLTHGEIWDKDKIKGEYSSGTYSVNRTPIYTAAFTTILKSFIFNAVSYLIEYPNTQNERIHVCNYEGPLLNNPTLTLYIKPIVTTVIEEKIVIYSGEPLFFEKTLILNPGDQLILDVRALDTADNRTTAVQYAIFGAKKT